MKSFLSENANGPVNGGAEEKTADWRDDVFGEGYKKPANSWPLESLEQEFRDQIQ